MGGRFVAWLLMVACAACGGGGSGGPTDDNSIKPPPNGVAQFTALPVDISRTPLLTPLGNLNPPGHTLPTDHVYFYQTNFAVFPVVPATAVLPVYAATTGAVNFMLQPAGTDWKIGFIATKDFGYYYDHLVPLPNIKVGTVVQAGEQVGTTTPGGAFDLGAYDLRVSHTGFVNPVRYGEQTLHYVSPWAYFVEPLRSQLYAKVRRHPSAADKDGKIDFGVAGRLVGDWFEQSVPNSTEASGPAGWPKSLAFVYDYYDPRQIRVVIGGTIAPVGVWTIPAGAPGPETVSVSSGKVAYRLMYTESFTVQSGLMLVQMVTSDRIKVEVFTGSQAGDAEFTAAAFMYVR